MGTESDTTGEEARRNPIEGVDPVQLMIWGVLLVAYGLYSTYRALNSEIEVSLIFFIAPYLVVTFFGVTRTD